VLNYAPLILQHVGFHSDTAAVLATIGLGVVKVTVVIATPLSGISVTETV